MNKLIIILIVLFGLGIGWYVFFAPKNSASTVTNATVRVENNTSNSNSSTNNRAVQGTPLVTQDGRTLISVESLSAEEEKIFKANPQLKKLSAYMGENELKRSLLQGLVSQEVMKEYINKQGIDRSGDYQADITAAYTDVERMINTKYFSQAFPVSVSDAEVRKFYDENKALMPNLVVSRGGVTASAVTFNTEAEAQAFLEKARGKNNLAAVAQEAGVSDRFVDFKVVNEQSLSVDPSIKSAVMTITQFPTAQMVRTSDNKYAVIMATAKEETQYRPLEQIRTELKEYLEKEKQAEAIEKEINKLKQQYNIVVNEEYFGPETSAEKAGEVLTPEMLEALEQSDLLDEALPVS